MWVTFGKLDGIEAWNGERQESMRRTAAVFMALNAIVIWTTPLHATPSDLSAGEVVGIITNPHVDVPTTIAGSELKPEFAWYREVFETAVVR